MKKSFSLLLALLLSILSPLVGQSVAGDSTGKVLYFTKSSGYEHSVVKRDGENLSFSERILTEAFACRGIDLVCSKDGGLISEESLEDFDTVIFYTSGNLLESGTDGQPPISPEGMEALLEWIRKGGGFIGVHAATDSQREEEPSDYTRMIGGAFEKHGKQEVATVRVVDPDFPALKGLPVEFRFREEWYLHTQVNEAKNMRVLAVLESGRMEQEMYNRTEVLPIIWCSAYGKGRVFYTALGHREDVWEMPLFQGLLIEACEWTSGRTEGDPSPNFEDILK